MTHDATNRFDPLDREERDALLTAYALGELEGTERASVERLLADPAADEARRIVAETGAVAAALRASRADDVPPRSADLRRAVVAALATARGAGPPAATPRGRRSTLSGWFALAGALAATALLAVTLTQTLRPAGRDVAWQPRMETPTTQAQGPAQPAPDRAHGTPAPAAPSASLAHAAPNAPAPAPEAGVASDGERSMAVPPGGVAHGLLGDRAAAAKILDHVALPPRDERAATGARETLRRAAEDRPTAGERSGRCEEDRFVAAAERPLSTFTLTVDAASSAVVRRFLAAGRFPPVEPLRVEDLVNAFPYAYPRPAGDEPCAVALEAAECPWRPGHRLVRIAIVGSAAVIAEDAEVGVAFDPAQVASYRLLGSWHRGRGAPDGVADTRAAATGDAGRAATALYEIVPVAGAADARAASRALLVVRLGFGPPGDAARVGREFPLADPGGDFAAASADTRFAAAVAAFGMILEHDECRGTATLDMVARIAADALGADEGGRRAEFLDLVRQAEMIMGAEHR